jgi:hypothetical protein
MDRLLSIWDILGFIVLLGPLFIVLIGLVYIGIETEIADRRRRSQEPKQDIEIRTHLIKYESTNTEVQHYLEDIRSQQIVGGPEFEYRTVFFIKWLIRLVIMPFALLSYEAYRTFDIVRSGGSPFVTHALAIMVLSLSIVVVSTYYGFFVKYGKTTTVNLNLKSGEEET